MAARASAWRRTSASESTPRSLPRRSAICASTTTCAVNAFVDATPISGPAWRYTPASVSRAIVDPTALTSPTARHPAPCAWRTAASVSAVSPDCEMTTTTSPSFRTGFR